uniref:CAAX prenyl protease 2 n=1 Tax=Onchocerca volvulus TaxID=6282 RepID=A0A8R1XNQ7_ONCVO
MSVLLYLSLAIVISSSYVGLLYAFDFNGIDRDDPQSIKRRLLGATVNNIISIIFTYAVLYKNYDSPLSVMGIHTRDIYPACLLPTLLTCICYLGNWVMMYIDNRFWSIFHLNELKRNIGNIIWIRDVLLAPITEEIAFRACATTLILQCLSSTVTIFVAPLPFALSHLHHIFDDMRKGYTRYEAISRRAFQTSYSYFFGAYATFLFVRTGHILAPILSHSVCNNMGLPLLPLIETYPKRSTRVLLWFSYFLGFILWLLLLKPLTDSKLYK